MNQPNQQQDVAIFNNLLFGDVEVLNLNGKCYFPAIKVATILGYSNPRKAVLDHCLDQGGSQIVTPFQTNGGVQNIKFIDEGNLYRLIMKSTLPLAQQFER